MPGILKYINATYEIKVSIMDHLGLYSEKTFKLNLTMDPIFYSEYKARVVPGINYISPKAGRISSISVFGEVTIKLNASNQFQARNFSRDELDQIDKNLINIYIEPSDGWDKWRHQNVSTLNFTWELREFNHKFIRIKLDFKDPTAVSPFPKYDKLKIHIPELPPLFENFPDRGHGRRLENITKYEWLIQKGI